MNYPFRTTVFSEARMEEHGWIPPVPQSAWECSDETTFNNKQEAVEYQNTLKGELIHD